MVLLRYGEQESSRMFKKGRFYSDTIWSTEREANARVKVLEGAGHYAHVTTRETKEGTEYTVWSNHPHKRGTQNAKKNMRRAIEKEKELEKEKKRKE